MWVLGGFVKSVKTYSEKLRDPRWQRRRLEVMERDDFKCKKCGSAEETLHVHHLAYKKGLQPWDHDSRYLLTLCKRCHREVGDFYLNVAAGSLLASPAPSDVLHTLVYALAESAEFVSFQSFDIAKLGSSERCAIALIEAAKRYLESHAEQLERPIEEE
jgi:hypothetical protein